MFSSFQLQLATAEAARRQNDRRTFSEPLHIAPSQTAAYKEFLSEFYQTIYKRRQELQVLLEQDVAGLGRFYQELVVVDNNENKDKDAAASAAAVSHEDFWQRYCWRCDANRILAEWNEKEQQVAAARSRHVIQQSTNEDDASQKEEEQDENDDDEESVPEQQEEDSLSFSNPPSSKDDSEHDGKSNTHNKNVPVAVAVVLQKQQENNQEQQQTPPSTTTSKKKWSWLWWTATLVVVAVAVAVAILQVQQPDLLSPLSSFFFSSSTTTTTTGAEVQVSPQSGSIKTKRAGFGRSQTPAASPVVDGHGDDDYYGYGYGNNEQQTPQVSYYYLMRRWVPALAKERVFSPIYGLFYTRTVLKWKPYYYYQEATTTTTTDRSGYDSNQNYYKNARESTRNNGQQNAPTESSNSFYRSTARLFNYY